MAKKEPAVNIILLAQDGMAIPVDQIIEEQGQEMDVEQTQGGNINFNGYQTQNFDICPAAVEAAGFLRSLRLDQDAQQAAMVAMETTDQLLGLEKIAVSEGMADEEIIAQAITFSNHVHYNAGLIWAKTGEDLYTPFMFTTDHVMAIVAVAQGKKTQEKMQTFQETGMLIAEDKRNERISNPVTAYLPGK